MSNAKDEFLILIKDLPLLKCAQISFGDYEYDRTDGEFDKIFSENVLLKLNYTESDYKEFLEKLDFVYDSGYGGQYLYGTVWFDGGTWAERGEYDGSEWWEYKELPEIPSTLSN